MNLQVKSFLSYLFFFVIFFSACKSNKKLGKDFVPSSEILEVLTDSSYLDFQNLRTTPTNTSMFAFPYVSSNSLLRSYHYFAGTCSNNSSITNNIETYTKLYYYSPVTVDQNAVVDSLELKFYTAGMLRVYGDTTSEYKLSFYRTNKNLDSTVYMTSDNKMEYENTPLASFTFKPIDIKDDTLSVNLPKTYAEEILNVIKNETASTDEEKLLNFHNTIRGVAIVAEGNGVLDFTPTAFSLNLFYSVSTSSSSINLSPGQSSTSIAAYYLGYQTQLKNKLSNFENGDSLSWLDTDGYVYLQQNSGLNARVKIPEFSNLKSISNKIVINKAEIIAKSNVTKDVLNISADSLIYMINSDKPSYKPNELLYHQYYGDSTYFYTLGAFDTKQHEYRFDVTNYIQKYILGQKSSSYLYIYNGYVGLQTLGNGDLDPRNYRIKIYYTKLK